MVISDVNAELNKLKPPTGEKADQGFIAFVEKVENICRDMETVSRMINVLVRKLPVKLAKDWARNKQKKNVGLQRHIQRVDGVLEIIEGGDQGIASQTGNLM